jgi:hypothetical protein
LQCFSCDANEDYSTGCCGLFELLPGSNLFEVQKGMGRIFNVCSRAHVHLGFERIPLFRLVSD